MNKKYNRDVLTSADFDAMNTLGFLEGLTKKVIDAAHTVDSHANVMVGVNTGIFVLVISMLFEVDSLRLTMGMVAIFSALSAIFAIFAIRLPHVFGHNEREKSLLHAPRIAEFGSAEAYADELQKMLDDDREIFRQHALEVYNLSKYYYIPKRKMLSYSRLFFLCGVMASAVFLLLEKLHWFMM